MLGGVRIVVDVVEDLQVTDAESGLVRLGLGVGLKLFLSGSVAETVDHRRERPTRGETSLKGREGILVVGVLYPLTFWRASERKLVVMASRSTDFM